MKIETTWANIRDAVINTDTTRVDHTHLRFKGLTVDPGLLAEEGEPVTPFMEFDTPNGGLCIPMDDRAYGQYLGKLGIPHGFATKFSPTLQNDMISERMASLTKNDTVFVRTSTSGEGMVRAILSGRYGDMRDREVVEILDGLMGKEGLEDYHVLRGRGTNQALVVTLVGRGALGKFGGDELFPMIQLRNSEVGASSFQVVTGTCKGACTNGMMFGQIKGAFSRIRHLGSKMDATVRVAMEQAVGGVASWKERALPAMERAARIEINAGEEKVVARVVKDLRNRSLTKKFALESIDLAQKMPTEVYGDEFPAGPVFSRWTLVNAMTHLAQTGHDQFARYDVEAAAGALLMSSLN